MRGFRIKSKKNVPALVPAPTLAPTDLQQLKEARRQMEQIGWAMEGLNKLGNIIDERVARLPARQQEQLKNISYNVLRKVVQVNLRTMDPEKEDRQPSRATFQALVTLSGAIGGAFGLAAFTADLALTTKLMMRSIMDIARAEGEDLRELDTQLACLQVFALGGKSKHDDSLDTGYYATRVSLQSAVKGVANPLSRILSQVAGRFSAQVSEKFAAQAIPVIGAAGGAAINMAFITHFQNMAQAHFSIRRLERKYGRELVERTYRELGKEVV